MNTEDLHIALKQSFSPDGNLRTPAETLIKGLKHVDGASMMLLQIAAEKQVQYEVRQAAAIQLKNICKECWAERVSFMGVTLQSSDGSPQVILKDNEKEQIKVMVMEALLAEPEKSIQDLMAETVHHISKHDFPDRWQALLPTLQHFIQQSDPSQALQVHNALVALRKVCKRYEFKSKEERGPLNAIIDQFFPILLPLAQRLSYPTMNSIEAALTLKQILKIFWSSTQYFIPEHAGGASVLSLVHPSTLQPWIFILQQALAKPLPEASSGEAFHQPESKEDRESWPWWKVKKWAAQIMVRLFSRYGVPSAVEKECEAFAQYFSKEAAPQFLGPVCETLNLRPSGKFCTDRVVHLCLSFIDLSIELSLTYKLIKPHLDFIIYKVCFPVICLSEDDIELFENDPHQFIHQQDMPFNEFIDPRSTATQVIISLVKHRGQDVINGLLVFLNNILQNYTNGSQNHVEKDASLQLIGSLAMTLFKKKKYVSQIEPLLVTHVFPAFQSNIAFLRSRACCVIQDFHFVQWSEKGLHLNTLIQLVLQALNDTALPVQIEAGKALCTVIKIDGAEETLLPFLPQILQEYIRIINEIGNEDVVSALKTIIDTFGEHIGPHAITLINQLVQTFMTYCSAGTEDDDAVMAATECFECISTVLKGVCDHPEIYKAVEPSLLPVIKQILGNDGEYIEYIESALDVLTFMTFFQEDISPALWEIFPMLYAAFDQWAFDYLNLMVPSLENYIGKSPQMFVSGFINLNGNSVKYIDLIFTMVRKTTSEHRAMKSEVRKALSLYMCILHNCSGLVDNYLPAINEDILKELSQSADDQALMTRITIFQIIGSALHYNPKLQLEELERRGAIEQVFTQWIKDSEEMKSWLSRKITVLGMASMLSLPTASLASINSGIPQIISCMTSLMEGMEAESQNAANQDDENKGFDNDNEEEDLRGFADNEDVLSNMDDDPYITTLLREAGATKDDFAQFLLGDDWDNGDDDDDYISPIDDIDTLMFYTNAMNHLIAREPTITSALSQVTINSYKVLLQNAASRDAIGGTS